MLDLTNKAFATRKEYKELYDVYLSEINELALVEGWKVILALPDSSKTKTYKLVLLEKDIVVKLDTTKNPPVYLERA